MDICFALGYLGGNEESIVSSVFLLSSRHGGLALDRRFPNK
jgi:hypothetical protein